MMQIKTWGLRLIDLINSVADPYDEFTRAMELPPGETVEERLNKLSNKFIADLHSRFAKGGFLAYQIPNDMGDMCIWNGVYAGMMCMRAHHLKDELANQEAKTAVEALCKFSEDRLVRGVVPDGLFEDNVFLVDNTRAAEYFTKGRSLRRDDASLDSFAGWLFGMACAIKFGQFHMVADNVNAFFERFKADGYKLRNRDGSATRYGDCTPGLLQGPIRNLATTTVARMSCIIDARAEWRSLAEKYKDDFANTETHFLHKHAYYNDNMAALIGAAYCLITPVGIIGREEAARGLSRLVRKHKKNGNSFFVYLAALCGAEVSKADLQNAEKILMEFSLSDNPPNGKAVIERINSKDVKTVKVGGRIEAAQPLPIWKRPASDFYWQRGPHDCDGYQGSGLAPIYMNCLDFLAAYWAKKLYEENR